MLRYEFSYVFIIVCMTSLLRTVLIRQAVEAFLVKGACGEKRYVAGYAVFFALTALLYYFTGVSLWYGMLGFFGMLALACLYDGSWKKRLWTAVSLFSIDLCCLLAAAFLMRRGAFEWSIARELMVGVLLFLASVVLISRSSYADAFRREMPEKKEALLLLAMPLAGIFVLFSVSLAEPENHSAAAFACVGVLFLNVSVFYLYDAVLKNYAHLRERDLYRQQTDIYKNQLEVITESGRRIRSLRHDMKNHLLALEQLAGSGTKEEIRAYVRDMQKFLVNPEEFAATGNEALDGVLNFKLRRARELSCAVKTKLSIPKELTLHSFDLNVILGNLLDNALEAAVQTEEKRLELALSAEKGVLFLTLCNSCERCGECRAGAPPRLKSTKPDRANHGFGLANVRRIVEKYQGEIDFVCGDGCFTADVMLYMKEL